MQTFIARQPVFDRWQQVVGYALLYHSDGYDFFSVSPDGGQGSKVNYIFPLLVLEELTRWKWAFIDFPREILVQQVVRLFPNDKLVIGLPEGTEPDDELVQACKAIKRAGYLLALSNSLSCQDCEPLLALVDFARLNFLMTPQNQRQSLSERLLARGIRLWAEGLETRQDFKEALSLGCNYFQGNFLFKPEIVALSEISPQKLNYLRFLWEVNRPDIDFDELEKLIKQDVALSFKLLRYINSAWVGMARKVNSLRHALVLLGIKGIKRWASLVAVTNLAQDKPEELVITSLLRARFCELLASFSPFIGREADLFLVGLFSLLDVLVGRPMEEILKEIAVPDEVRSALLGAPSRLYEGYQLVLAYEKGEWKKVSALAQSLSLDEKLLPEVYKQAVHWVNRIVAAEQPLTSDGRG